MENFKKLIQNTIVQINEVTGLFYQQKNREAFNKFNDILTMLNAIAQELFTLDGISEEDKMAYLKHLTEAMNAMEAKDSILLSDILQYDMVEYLEELGHKV